MVDWKKEISFGGGGKKKENADEANEPKAESTPIWKKEISLGGKSKQQKAESGEPDVPFWKKEISFGRKQKDEAQVDAVAEIEQPEPEVEATEPEVDVAAAVELLSAYVPEAPQHVVAEVFEEPAPAPEPVVELVPAPAPEPVEQPTIQFPVAVPDLEPVAEVVDFMAPSLPATPDVVPVPEPDPVAVAPAPEPQPEPVVVHPPVPAAALPPVAEEQPEPKRKKKKEKPAKEQGERVPFYKRDLSFGKKKDKQEQVAEDEPKQEGEQKKKEKPEKPKRERRSLSLPRPQPRAKSAKPAKGGKLPKRIVGLKIGASQVAAASVENNGHAEVVQVARQALDPGIVSNGELREPDLLAEALKQFFAKNKLPKRGVRLGIATNRIGVRTLEIAGIEDAKQLANAIRFRAQEALPIPIDEAVLDYQVLSETKNEEGETVRKILLVLAYRDLIDRYVAACKKAGIQLVGIDLEAFALLRALAAPPEANVDAQAALVAVTVGHDRTTFAVSDGRVCEFTRVLDWGGHSLNVAIARALDMAPSEVDGFKRELTVDGHEVPEGLREEQANQAREALRRQVQSFARELVSSLQFYQNQPGSLGIGEIVLTGGTAHLGGFADELQRLIGVRVRVGDPLVRVKVGKKLREPEQLGSFAVAIGLGIED